MDLFNNQMVNKALMSMTKEEIDNYKKIGEQLYGTVNFEDSKVINALPPPMEEAVAYVESGIKSGLLPCDLDENEIALLTESFGKEWYKRYGFKEEEVPEVGLSMAMKKNIEESVEKKINMCINKKQMSWYKIQENISVVIEFILYYYKND